MTEFAVQEGNVTEVPADLLLLKFSQGFHGADRTVASLLIKGGVCREVELRPAPGDFVTMETKGIIAPGRVLFLGTPPLARFTYNEMEVFARRAIEKIAALGPPVRVLTTTVHGSGYGLDGGEALQCLVRGFREGLSSQPVADIERITFLTLGKRAERMLSQALRAMATGGASPAAGTTVAGPANPTGNPGEGPVAIASATESISAPVPVSPATPTDAKIRVFVALPFSEEFENVYKFGIRRAVDNCGFICERVDETHFTGDVLKRIRGGIEAADLVVADLTGGRPNVYLEVGYAWGRDIPVIFVARKGEDLHFDVSTHRCIFYGEFTKFAKDLERLIRGIEITRKK